MSLSFSGPSGTAEHRWIVYALLRDNVQHHLEGGASTGTFASIHAVDQALGGTAVAVNARRLRSELERAKALLDRPIAELAVSQRTRAVIEGSWPAPEEQSRLTTLAGGSATIPWLSSGARTLDDVFGNLVRSLLGITAGAGETDVVEVDDS